MARANVFISYARSDDPEFVDRLEKRLTAATDVVGRVWRDLSSMESRGQTFLQVIGDSIAELDWVLLVVGPKAKESAYVQREWREAIRFGKVVLPLLRIGDQDLVPSEFRSQDTIDFRGAFDAAFDKLLTNLRKGVAPVGRFLTAVPALPPNFLLRESDLNDLEARVLDDLHEPVLAGPSQRVTIIPAVPGSGKTTLATAFVRSASVRRAFPEGIVWLDYPLRADADSGEQRAQVLLGLLNRAGAALDPGWRTQTDFSAARNALHASLTDRRLLLVLDNVSDADDVEPFRRSMGEPTRILATTRNQNLAESLAALEFELGLWREGPWAELLAQWAGTTPPQLPEAAARVAALCDYLPLALAVSGSNARELGWDALARELEANGQKWLDADLPGYYKSVFAAFDSSVSQLGAAKDRYLDLAGFVKGAAIPQSAILALWKLTAGLEGIQAVKLLGKLVERSLCSATGQPPERFIRMLDSQADYVRSQCRNAGELQAKVLESYAAQAPAGWPSGPNDGYFFQYLGKHLRAAGRETELEPLVLASRWLEAKLEKCGAESLLDDLGDLPRSTGANAIRDAIVLSEDALRTDPALLGGQLTARLLGRPESGIATLLQNIPRTTTRPWLRPLAVSLTTPGRLARLLTGHDWVVMAMALSADGRYLVSTSSQTIVLWNTATWKHVRSLEVPDLVWSLAVTPDNKQVLGLTGMFEADLTWWSLENGHEERRLRIPMGAHDTGLAVTANGRVFAAERKPIGLDAARAKLIEVGGAGKSEIVLVCEGTSGAMVARGNTLAFGLHDGSLMTLDCATGGVRPVPIARLSAPAKALAIDCAGRFVVAGCSDGRVHIVFLDGSTASRDWQAHAQGIDSLAVTEDPAYVVTSDRAGVTRVWEAASGAEQSCFERHGRTSDRVEMAVTRDGHYAADTLFNLLRVWDLRPDSEDGVQPDHAGGVERVAITPDGRYALSAGMGIKRWDVESGKVVGSFAAGHGFQDLAVTPDGSCVLAREGDGSLRIFDTAGGQELKVSHKPGALGGFALTPDGLQCIWASGSKLQRWSLDEERLLAEVDAGWGRISQIAATAKLAVAACQDKTVRVWMFDTGELFELKGHTNIVETVAVTADGRHAVSGCDDQTIRVWDIAARREAFRFPGPEGGGHTHWIRAVAVSDDGRFVVSGGYDRRVIVWDWRTRERVATFIGDSMIRTCAFAPDNLTVIAGEMSGWVHVLRLENALKR